MMKLWQTLLLSLLGLSALSAQSDPYYTVQIGTFIDAKPSDFEGLRDIGFVHARELDGNLAEIYLGGYEDRPAAESMAEQARNNGYPNAFVKQWNTTAGSPAAIVQIATRQVDKPIDWEKLSKAGKLQALPAGNLLKIAIGPYTSRDAANAALPQAKALGYSDAFVKTVNTARLIPITPFSTGIKEPLIPLALDENAPRNADMRAKGPDSYNQSGERLPPSRQLPRTDGQEVYDAPPEAYEVLSERAPGTPPPPPTVPDIPASYDYYDGDVNPRTGNAAAAPNLPAIDGSVKRGSVLSLQKILKADKAYTGSLDGYYGPGTTKGYETYVENSRTLQQYQLLAEQQPLPGNQGGNTGLQKVINQLADGPAVAAQLDAYRNDPLAKAYQAYQLFTQYGQGSEVNQLMNTAINGAFEGKPLAGLPFDPNSSYAYDDISQLILHLHYIHAAPATEESAPCWLMYRHPEAAAKAYEVMASMVGDELRLQGCGQFESWPEVRTLVMIASDINGAEDFNEQRLSKAATERSRLYMAPKPLNAQETKSVQNWDKNLISGVDKWIGQDPMHARLGEAFKAMYYQTQVRLEDYYMDKGLKSKEASALALATLHTLVAYHMERFV